MRYWILILLVGWCCSVKAQYGKMSKEIMDVFRSISSDEIMSYARKNITDGLPERENI